MRENCWTLAEGDLPERVRAYSTMTTLVRAYSTVTNHDAETAAVVKI